MNTSLKQSNRTRRSLKHRNRLGSTAVEFAMVCPLIFALVFGLFEMSRAMTISDSMRTSVIAGAREAGIAQTTADNVIAEMEETLDLFRVRNRTIVVTPDIIDASVDEVTINISIPLDTSNGVVLHRVIGADEMTFARTITR